MPRILILEDEIDVVDALKGMLEEEGHIVEAEMNPAAVMEKIRQFEPQVITLDVSFSENKDTTGIGVLKEIRRSYTKQELPVIAISGTMDANKLSRMLELGLDSYIGKPPNPQLLVKKIEACLITQIPAHPIAWQQDIIGKSPAIMEMLMEIDNVAKSGGNLLITGESGTGKELVVQKYRQLSSRKNAPFVTIDCTNIHEQTFESEIFGHVKGAFTGATANKKGKIEEAEGGIVFFDEISKLPLSQQQKLLRLLQNKEFSPMGTNDKKYLDASILASTNKSLFNLMQTNQFLKDLYYRLQYMKIEVPPLRERKEDLPLLVEHFIKEFNLKYRKSIENADSETLEWFRRLCWDGNIRQLENCLEVATLKCEGKSISWKDVEKNLEEEVNQLAGKSESKGSVRLDQKYEAFKQSLDASRKDLERQYYLHHLKQHKNNVSQTACALGIGRTYLDQILKRLGINKE